jgi:hypothetical protein
VRQLLECSIPQSTHARASFRAGAKTQAQELIKRDKVVVILGPFAQLMAIISVCCSFARNRREAAVIRSIAKIYGIH